MSPLRRVPPVHSPVPARALAAGLRALVTGDTALRGRMAARVARRYGARRVLFTDSGTSALTLALAGAATIRDTSRVALPGFGCYDLITAVRGAGAEPVLYDLDRRTLSPDPSSLRRAVGSGVGAVVAAHLYGVPVDLDEVTGATEEAGALVVEDAAQGVGASYRGHPLGSFGSVAVLSFGRGKGLSGGGGGALLAHDAAGEAVLEAAGEVALPPPGRGARELAVAAAQSALARPSLYGLPAALPFLGLGETTYRPPLPPRGIAPACLAVLEGSWAASLRAADHRRRRADRLLRRVQETDALSAVEPPPAGSPGYLRLPVVARGEATRARLSSPGARRLGVMPAYPKPLDRLEAFREVPTGAGDGATPRSLAGSEALAESLFTLPVHSRMSRGDLDRLEELVAPGG